MTKKDFVEQLATGVNLTLTSTEIVINRLFEKIAEVVKTGDQVKFSGFGKFYIKHRSARMGINPKDINGAQISQPASVVPKFKAGMAFKGAVQ